jgi:glycosyltransferase involved in cell wall biosynthesis
MEYAFRKPDYLVSVIIPIRPKEDISLVLSSLNNSTYKNIEIIVVDEGLERSDQRNIGIARAKGEYLLILDSDQAVSPVLIEECVTLAKFGYSAVYIPEVIKTKGLFAYIRNWERQFYTATPIDVVRFVRKDCPYFDNTMSGPEDSDWDRRVEGRRLTSVSPLYHYDNIGVLDYFRKKAYYSKSMRRFADKHPNDKVLDWKWRCFGVFLENGKWKKFLARPDLTILVLGIIFIRGLIYYAKK